MWMFCVFRNCFRSVSSSHESKNQRCWSTFVRSTYKYLLEQLQSDGAVDALGVSHHLSDSTHNNLGPSFHLLPGPLNLLKTVIYLL